MERATSPTARLALTAQLADPIRPAAESAPVLQWFASSRHLGVDTFGLAEAIQHGFLRDYDYHIRPIQLRVSDSANDASTLMRQYSVLKQEQGTRPRVFYIRDY